MKHLSRTFVAALLALAMALALTACSGSETRRGHHRSDRGRYRSSH